MKPGLYEQLITEALDRSIKSYAHESGDLGELAPQVLGRHVFDALVKAFRNIPAEERGKHQLELANKLLERTSRAAATEFLARSRSRRFFS